MKRSVLKRFLDACQSPLGCEADEKTGIPTVKAILSYSTIVATRPGSNILGEMGQIQNGILGRSPLLLSNSLELVRESSALENAKRVFHELENFQINLIRWTKFGNCAEARRGILSLFRPRRGCRQLGCLVVLGGTLLTAHYGTLVKAER